jgi:hypothetical protein
MLRPNHPEKLQAIAELVALAVSRMQARKASELSAHTGDRPLDILGIQSGHPNPLERRTADA